MIDDYLALIDSGVEPYEAAVEIWLIPYDENDPLAVYKAKTGPQVIHGAAAYYSLVTNGGITGLFQNAPEETKLAIDAMERLGFQVIADLSREALAVFGLPEIFSWDEYDTASEKLTDADDEKLDQIDDEILGSNFDDGFGDVLKRFILRNRSEF